MDVQLPAYLLFNYPHIFLPSRIDLSVAFFLFLAYVRACVRVHIHILFHLSVSSYFRRAVPVKREPYLGLVGTR